MRLRNVAHQRQPKSRPFCVVYQGIATAVELLENLTLFCNRDSDPMILNLKLDATVGAVKTDTNVFLVF